jgi:hypothetical protein
MKHLALGALTVLALSLSLGACGGGGGSSSTEQEGPTISRLAFIKKAAAICQQHSGVLRSQLAKYLENAPASKSEAALYEELKTEAFVPEVEKELEDLQALPKPDGSEAEAAAMLEEMEAGIANLKTAKFQTITDFSPSMDEYDEAAKDLEIEACSFSG